MGTQFDFDLQQLRSRMKDQAGGRARDPNEFQPAKAKDAHNPLVYRYYVLPGLEEGDKCATGKVTRGMEGMFSIKNGNHWVNQRPHACPRVLSDEDCELCQSGFDLLAAMPNDQSQETKDKRAQVRRRWLASANFMVNLYFPHSKKNPEELRGRVLWYNAPKTVFDMWYSALCRDDAGEKEDPQAFGVFFNPAAAFLFQQEALPNGQNNGYKTSKFLANLGPHPIAYIDLEDGGREPDRKKIQSILDSRHDLWTKIEMPVPKKMRQLAMLLKSGASDVDNDEEGDADANGKASHGARSNGDVLAEEQPARRNGKKPAAAAADGDDTQTTPAKPAKKPAAAAADDDDDTPPAKPAKKPAAAAPDDDDDVAPAKPAKTAKKPAAAADDDDDTPPAKPAKKPAAAAADDDDDDVAPAKPAKKAAAAADDDDAGDEDAGSTRDVQSLLSKLRKDR